jgi:ABC-type amino acid transport substrate-binding protein
MRILTAAGKRRVVFITIAILMYLASISFPAVAQTTLDEQSFKLGVRTIVPPVEKFCDAFKEVLQQKISSAPDYENATVDKKRIVNEYKGKYYYRYAGILDRDFDIAVECGPNSISSGNLEKPDSGGAKYDEFVDFSEPFHKTGIKLLLKEEQAERLKKASPSEINEILQNLRIAAFVGTTTIEQLKSSSYWGNSIVPVDAQADPEDPENTERGTSALERVLTALDDKDGKLDTGEKIDALASDAMIVYSLWKDDVEPSGEEGYITYTKARNGYRSKGYAVFPSQDFPSPAPDKSEYLPETQPEEYGIVLKKDSWLLPFVNSALEEAESSASSFSQIKADFVRYESGASILSPPELPTEPREQLSEPSSVNKEPSDSDTRWWLPIVIPVISVLGAIIIAILNPELVRVLISGKQRTGSNGASRVITGRVLDARSGTWIRGAKVTLEGSGTPPVEYTDNEGVFEFLVSASANRIRLRVEANGYEMFDRRVDVSNSEAVHDIRLSIKL